MRSAADILLSPVAAVVYGALATALVVIVVLDRIGVPLPPWLSWIAAIGDVVAAVLGTLAAVALAIRPSESTDGGKESLPTDDVETDAPETEAEAEDYQKPEIDDDETTRDQPSPRSGDTLDRDYFRDPAGDGPDD